MKESTILFIALLFFSGILSAQTFEIDLKLFLESAYNNGIMSTKIQEHIPLSQPFNKKPWNYEGDESVTEIPSNVVDWVLVELRKKDEVGEMVKQQAAFILNDGHIASLNGLNPLGFHVPNDDYYVAVHHRNHLSVLSSTIAYCSTCPDVPTVTYGDKTYNTVQIGTQCWLRENLDIGTMINGSEEMTDNGIIEKYCYDDNPNNCEKYGGLYQWNEALQYKNGESAQGICPEGWHLPILWELETLMDFVNSKADKLVDQNQMTIGYTPTNESGFSALFTGDRSEVGRFSLLDWSTHFWSYTQHFSGTAYSMSMSMSTDYNNVGIVIHGYDKIHGFCIRCLKN